MFYDRGNHHNFISLVRSLSPPGTMDQSTTFDFEFINAEKPHESYTGVNVRLRYSLFVTSCFSPREFSYVVVN